MNDRFDDPACRHHCAGCGVTEVSEQGDFCDEPIGIGNETCATWAAFLETCPIEEENGMKTYVLTEVQLREVCATAIGNVLANHRTSQHDAISQAICEIGKNDILLALWDKSTARWTAWAEEPPLSIIDPAVLDRLKTKVDGFIVQPLSYKLAYRWAINKAFEGERE